MTGPAKTVLFGATKGMGRALARLLADRGDDLFLLGRDPADLAKSAADLVAPGIRGRVGTGPADLADPAGFPGAFDAAEAFLRGLSLVVLTAGEFARQEDLENDPARAGRLLAANFTNSILFLEEARRRLLARGGGTLVAFSSVAGDRGRKPVVLYGAAKAGLSAYLEGLDHRHRRQGLVVVCVKPGFVRTGMTAGLPAPPFAGEPGAVAARVLRAVERRRPVVYAPAAWRLVMAVVRRLPRAVMRRVDF